MTQQALRAGGDGRCQDVKIYPEKLIATMRQFGSLASRSHNGVFCAADE